MADGPTTREEHLARAAQLLAWADEWWGTQPPSLPQVAASASAAAALATAHYAAAAAAPMVIFQHVKAAPRPDAREADRIQLLPGDPSPTIHDLRSAAGLVDEEPDDAQA